MSNSFGRLFKLTTFGESHGSVIGGVVDGCPAGLDISEEKIQLALDSRRPGFQEKHGSAASTRNEPDKVQILSGILEGQSTGTPIGFLIPNKDPNSADYEKLKDVFRPGHADFAVLSKYGVREHRGGGRFSGRETASRVVGGAIAEALLEQAEIKIKACTIELGGIKAALPRFDRESFKEAAERRYYSPDEKSVQQWDKVIEEAKQANESLGGVVQLVAFNMPAGLGEPIFDKLDARIGSAMFSIGAVKGVEIGAGFRAARMKGSENNDAIFPADDARHPLQVHFGSNNSGGILGGISSGQDLVVTIAVKPIPTISLPQRSVDIYGQAITMQGRGRNDICAIPRIVPVLKAMLALTLADFLLLNRSSTMQFGV